MTDFLPSDFYGFQGKLSAAEQEHVLSVREFFQAEVAPIADEYWLKSEFPMQLVPGLAELGVFGSALPAVRQFETTAVARGWIALEMARVDAGVATFVGVQNGLAMGSIDVGGSPEQQQKWLPGMASGELLGAFGLTEPLSGSDSARGLRTVVRREGDTWTLDGAKRWIGNATLADFVIVLAKDAADGQVKGFVVPADSEGFTATKIENKIALRSVQNADITLQGVVVPEENRLAGIDSFRDVATVLRLTRCDVAWQAIGIAVGAYEAAVSYAKTREQFGKPIGSHQLVQDLLARCLANITASIALCVQASTMLDEGTQRDEHSALAKSFATSRMRETVGWAREVLGGNGIVLDHGVARFFVDAEAIYSYEGTREMNSLIVGRSITGHNAFV